MRRGLMVIAWLLSLVLLFEVCEQKEGASVGECAPLEVCTHELSADNPSEDLRHATWTYNSSAQPVRLAERSCNLLSLSLIRHHHVQVSDSSRHLSYPMDGAYSLGIQRRNSPVETLIPFAVMRSIDYYVYHLRRLII